MEAVPASVTDDGDENVQVSYFGFGGIDRYEFPDNHSWLEIAVMNEGTRRKYQSITTRDMKVNRNEEASFSLDQGGDREALFLTVIKGWNLVNAGSEVAFNRSNLQKFIDEVDPRLADSIDERIREINPWMITDASVEEMEKEIDRLEGRIKTAKKVEEGKE